MAKSKPTQKPASKPKQESKLTLVELAKRLDDQDVLLLENEQVVNRIDSRLTSIEASVSTKMATKGMFEGHAQIVSQLEQQVSGLTKALAVVVLVFVGVIWWMNKQDRGGADPQPRPSPTPIDNGKDTQPKKLTGTILAISDRLPMSKAQQELIDKGLAAKSETLNFASADVSDKDERIQAIIGKAKSVGIDPPLIMHKSTDGAVRFMRWPADWSAIEKEFSR